MRTTMPRRRAYVCATSDGAGTPTARRPRKPRQQAPRRAPDFGDRASHERRSAAVGCVVGDAIGVLPRRRTMPPQRHTDTHACSLHGLLTQEETLRRQRHDGRTVAEVANLVPLLEDGAARDPPRTAVTHIERLGQKQQLDARDENGADRHQRERFGGTSELDRNDGPGCSGNTAAPPVRARAGSHSRCRPARRSHCPPRNRTARETDGTCSM